MKQDPHKKPINPKRQKPEPLRYIGNGKYLVHGIVITNYQGVQGVMEAMNTVK